MYEGELKLAVQAVDRAENTFRKYHGVRTATEQKQGDYRDLVSDTDRRIEETIRDFLRRHTPEHGFLGEESGPFKTDSEFVWVLDPIDGTTNYLQGLPECAISLALTRSKHPVVGVVSAPLLNQLYTARLGGRARHNGRRIRVAQTTQVLTAVGALGWGRQMDFAVSVFPRLLPLVRKLRMPGSAALAMCRVAQGSYDFLVATGMNSWDFSAAQIVLEEAGGHFQSWANPPLQIAGNKALVRKLYRRLKIIAA